MGNDNFKTIKENLTKQKIKIVKKQIENLIKNNKYDDKLLELFEDIEKHKKSLLLIWIAVIFGEKKNKQAIKPLIKCFRYPEATLLHKAAETALKKISLKHKEKVWQQAKNWLDNFYQKLNKANKDKFIELHEKYKARSFLFYVLEALSPKKEVKNYLFNLLRKDHYMNGYILMSLLWWKLPENLESLFIRETELALLNTGGQGEINMNYQLCKWALIYYKKKQFSNNFIYKQEILRDIKNDWQKQWQPLFDQWNKSINKNEQNENAQTKEDIKKQMKEQEEQRKKELEFTSFEIPKFNLEHYLKFRKREDVENNFQGQLDKFNLNIQVEDIQKQFNHKNHPIILHELFKKTNFENEKDRNNFTKKFLKLWWTTPQEKYSGLTEGEKKWFEDLPNKYKGGDIGRNDPCPCGATDNQGNPKKYKKCCGKKFNN